MKNKNSKKETYKKVGIGVGLVIVVAVIILLLLRSCGAPANDPAASSLTPRPPRAAGMRPTWTPSATRSTRRSRRA